MELSLKQQTAMYPIICWFSYHLVLQLFVTESNIRAYRGVAKVKNLEYFAVNLGEYKSFFLERKKNVNQKIKNKFIGNESVTGRLLNYRKFSMRMV